MKMLNILIMLNPVILERHLQLFIVTIQFIWLYFQSIFGKTLARELLQNHSAFLFGQQTTLSAPMTVFNRVWCRTPYVIVNTFPLQGSMSMFISFGETPSTVRFGKLMHFLYA
ncbi:hypothetical protein D3C72_1903850 [compost metagenome]